MNKPILGLLLGGFLGIFDGLSALFTAPGDEEVRAGIGIIVCMSMFKGLIAGLAIGFFSKKFRSLPLGIVFGLGVGLLLALPIAMMNQKYFVEILIPGGLVGLLVGVATQMSRSATASRTEIA